MTLDTILNWFYFIAIVVIFTIALCKILESFAEDNGWKDGSYK